MKESLSLLGLLLGAALLIGAGCTQTTEDTSTTNTNAVVEDDATADEVVAESATIPFQEVGDDIFLHAV